MPTLITPRLTLKEATPSDIPQLQKAISPWDIAKWLTIPYPYTLEDATYWVHEGAQDGLHFLIFHNHNLIGGLGLTPTSNPKCLEIGYWLVATEQGKGFAKEAVSALLEYAKQHLSTYAIVAKCLAENTASAALLKKLGFLYVCTEKTYSIPRQQHLPCYFFEHPDFHT